MAPLDRLVEDVMAQEPYRSARRVFWISDNGSSHRGQKADQRLRSRWPSIIPVHTPVHASWLNQVEIYFSIIQRKALTPGDFASLAELEAALLAFQYRYEKSAAPSLDLHTSGTCRPPATAQSRTPACRSVTHSKYVTVIPYRST
jgi:hypothetical protein